MNARKEKKRLKDTNLFTGDYTGERPPHSGKLGIGVHSNWVVLNSLFQQMENKPTLVNGYNQKTGQAIPFSMRIGEFVSHGKLGQTTALEPETKEKRICYQDYYL